MKKLLSLLIILVAALPALSQDVYTIYEINQGVVPQNTLVTIEDVIITGVTGYGFYVQEPASGEYSGIWIYTTSGAPPSVARGDVVTVIGEYYEYYDYAEIDVSTDPGSGYTVTGTAPEPAPEVLRAIDVKTSNPAEAEKWESVLVQLQFVVRLPEDPGYNQYMVLEYAYADNDTAMCDAQFVHGDPMAGLEVESLTGLLRYHYDEFKVNPRDNADIVYVGTEPAPNLSYAVVTGPSTIDVRFDRQVDETTAENPWNYFLDAGLVSIADLDAVETDLVHLTTSAPMATELYLTLTVFDVQNVYGIPMTPQDVQFWGGINTCAFANTPDGEGDLSIIDDQMITVLGIVQCKFTSHVYMCDAAGGDYSGIEVYCPAIIDGIAVGDELIIGDVLNEYYNQTSLTYPFYYYEVASTGNTPPGPVTMPVVDGTDFEIYEGRLAFVDDVTVTSFPNWENYYEWTVTQDFIASLIVDDMGEYSYQAVIGDILDITGLMRYAYDAYRINPRDDADIVIIFDNPPTDALPDGARCALGQNFPNPFNPATEISFRLDKGGQARLEVYDLEGRLVQTLHQGILDAGEHSVTWRGETLEGGQAASGVYLYRLITEDETLGRKMLLVK